MVSEHNSAGVSGTFFHGSSAEMPDHLSMRPFDYDLSGETHQRDVLHEQIALLYRSLFISGFSNIVAGLLFVTFMWPFSSHNELLIWLVMLMIVSCARLLFAFLFSREAARFSDTVWQRLFMTGAVVSGLIWGLGALWFFTDSSAVLQVALAFTVFAISAGAVATHAFQWQPSVALIVLTILPLDIMMLLQGGYLNYALAAVLSYSILFLSLTALRVYNVTLTNIKTRLEAIEKGKHLEYSSIFQRNLLSDMADALITLDNQGSVLLSNTAAERLFGYQGAELQHRKISELLTLPEIDTRASRHIKTTATHHDGHQFMVELVTTPIKLRDTTIISCLLRDMTERQQYEQMLINARDEAESANRAKSEFLSSMSHELRTPLNAILGFSQLLEMSLQDEENIASVRQILVAGEHLLALINDVLDLSRIEAGHFEVESESVDIGPLVTECIELTRPLAEKGNIQISSRFSNDGETVLQADRRRLKQILINLLSNAIKYNRVNGSVMVVSEQTRDRRLRITISDTGTGVAKEKQSSIFQPFERAGIDHISGIEGTGIGLAVTQKLLEMMNGEIDMSSVPGEGSSFWITLPLSMADDTVRQ